MFDPRNDLLPPASSPTISSVSSSDLDTESTGSFFHDRSITLGTLMGVSFPAITFRASSQHHASPAASISRARSNKRRQKRGSSSSASTERQRRRKWWRLCRDDKGDGAGGGGGRPSSLGEYLEVERRSGHESFYGGAEAELDGLFEQRQQQPPSGGRMLFAEGRVLPPAVGEAEDIGEETSTLCGFPVSLTGMCSGGVGS